MDFGEYIRILELAGEKSEPQELDSDDLIKVIEKLKESKDKGIAVNERIGMGAGEIIDTNPSLAKIVKIICAHLEQAQKLDRFNRLIVVAPKDVSSLLKKNLSPPVREMIILEIEADLVEEDGSVIRASLPI